MNFIKCSTNGPQPKWSGNGPLLQHAPNFNFHIQNDFNFCNRNQQEITQS